MIRAWQRMRQYKGSLPDAKTDAKDARAPWRRPRVLLSGQTRWEARRPDGPPLEPGGKDLSAQVIRVTVLFTGKKRIRERGYIKQQPSYITRHGKHVI